ncbi:MAG TPA: TetR/AcrR family transcriptional regulator [Ktedonobacteraceae bacterium]|nr:TetR/AcrR family transcriptional regulator [Ktedonobacteraceae bacterium]
MERTMASTSYRNESTASRRQAILQAALQLFLSKGFTVTTMEDIRQLSGASTGSIYHHFENKEMLALALYQEIWSELNAVLLQCLTEVTPHEGVKALVYAYIDWFEQHPDSGQYIVQAINSEYLGSRVETLRQTMAILPQKLFEWLTPAIENGAVIHCPQHLYYSLILGPAREYVRSWLKGRIPGELHEVREVLADAAWRVIARETDGKRGQA